MAFEIKPGEVPFRRWGACFFKQAQPMLIGGAAMVLCALAMAKLGVVSDWVVVPFLVAAPILVGWSWVRQSTQEAVCPYCNWPLHSKPESNGGFSYRGNGAFLSTKTCPKCHADFTVPFEKGGDRRPNKS